MNDLVLDASVALQWFLEDEADRQYSLAVLSSLSKKRAVVPSLWFYEVGNGLLMAQRRKRIRLPQVQEFLTRLRLLPIDATEQTPSEILALPALAHTHQTDQLRCCISRAGWRNQPAVGDKRYRFAEPRPTQA